MEREARGQPGEGWVVSGRREPHPHPSPPLEGEGTRRSNFSRASFVCLKCRRALEPRSYLLLPLEGEGTKRRRSDISQLLLCLSQMERRALEPRNVAGVNPIPTLALPLKGRGQGEAISAERALSVSSAGAHLNPAVIFSSPLKGRGQREEDQISANCCFVCLKWRGAHLNPAMIFSSPFKGEAGRGMGYSAG